VVQLALLFLLGGSVVESHRIPSSQFPCDRVTGIAREGNRWLAGGLRGLFLGAPGGPWRQASDQSVKSMTPAKSGTWVLYGSGGLDKVEIGTNRLFDDIVRGVSKRPWVASLAQDDDTLILGGQGGWMVRGKNGLTETYPPELKGRPVTAISRVGATLWLGTQEGLFFRDAIGIHRLGFGAGMPDLWVTAMLPSRDGVVAGLASGGLVRVSGGMVEPVEGPSKRVRYLARWHGSLVMGALDGAWIRKGSQWTLLTESETTFLSQVGNELVVGTPAEICFYRWTG
jgi:hypothetical protein